MYQTDNSEATTIMYSSIQNVIVLHHESHCQHAGENKGDVLFQKVLTSCCEQGILEEENWNILKTGFIQNTPNASDSI